MLNYYDELNVHSLGYYYPSLYLVARNTHFLQSIVIQLAKQLCFPVTLRTRAALQNSPSNSMPISNRNGQPLQHYYSTQMTVLATIDTNIEWLILAFLVIHYSTNGDVVRVILMIYTIMLLSLCTVHTLFPGLYAYNKIYSGTYATEKYQEIIFHMSECIICLVVGKSWQLVGKKQGLAQLPFDRYSTRKPIAMILMLKCLLVTV